MKKVMVFCCLIMMAIASNVQASQNTLLPDVKALALDKLVLDRANSPITVLETPPITNSKGEIAKGMTEVLLTLDPSAKNALIIQGKTLDPGGTLSIVQDLSATGGALKIPTYPKSASVSGISRYQLDIPKVTAELCSDDYTYDQTNNVCLKVNTTNLAYTCPDSSWKSTGDLKNCIQETTIAKESCPAGYVSNNNGTCTLTEYLPTVPECNSGYSYNTSTKRCEKTLTESAFKTCSDATYTYNSSTNDCRKTVTTSVTYNCAAGYSYNSSIKKCERTLTTVADKVCASGYTYSSSNNRCEKATSVGATPVCSSGYAYSTTNKRCEKTTVVDATKVCASGYAYISANDRCEKTTTVSATPVCSSGYTYSTSNNRCEKTTTTAASKICASGYTYSSSNNRCEKATTVSANKVCASGYTYSSINNRCEKTTTTAASKVCASGYTYSSSNNRCEKTTTTAASKVCASGYTYSSSNNRCEKTTTTSASLVTIYSCPPETENESTSFCWIDDYRDLPNQTCPAGWEREGYECYTPKTSEQVYRCDSGFTLSGTTCSKLETASFSYSCASGSTLSGSTCSKLETASFSYSCASGYTLSGSTCSKLQTASFSYSCASGYTLSGSTCSKLETASFSYSCSSGYTLSGSTCSKLQTATNTWSCSSGYTLSGSTCSKLQTANFSYSCSSGYTLSGSTCSKLQTANNTWSCSAGTSLSGDKCLGTDTLSFSYSCPTNYTNHNNGSCSLYQSTGYTLSCSNSNYTPNTSTEICERVLTASHIYQCNDSNYTLSGSSCSLLLTETEAWICDDITYTKINETQCRRFTDSDLSGVCPANYVKSGNTCELTVSVPQIESCPATYTRVGASCERDVFKAPVCEDGLLSDSSCICPTGTNLNTSTWMCEGVETSSVIKTCPVNHTLNGNQCEFTHDTGVVFDYCPLGMTSSGSNCILNVMIPATDSCTAPYSVVSGQCQYTDTLPAGYGGSGIEAKTYEGNFVTESSAIQLAQTEFNAVVSDITEIVLDVDGGCRFVANDTIAQGNISKGDVPCSVTWTDLPKGITGTDNKLSGIFETDGLQTITYQLKAFDGKDKNVFLVTEGELTVDVSMPSQPVVTDITTRMMNKVISGFEMFNYDASSKINLTTALVEPKNYEQVIEIEGLGDCTVPVNGTSCNIYSNESFERNEEELTFTSSYQIWGNSKVGGWDKSELTAKDWNIEHDFRGPLIKFAEFNGNKLNDAIINTDLGYEVQVEGGEGAVGIGNFRSEIDDSETWWKPTRVTYDFVTSDGKESISILNVNDVNIMFDVPNSTGQNTVLNNYKVIQGDSGNAYPIQMTTLTPGNYTVNITAKDSYNNESVTSFENIKVATPAPQIKVVNKKAVVSATSVASVTMLDDLMIVAHNGFEGETEITSVKIDGKEVSKTNDDNYFSLLTSEGLDLAANSTYTMTVEAVDSEGAQAELTMDINYLRMQFGFSRKPTTVIQLVEDVNLAVYRTQGLRCDLYGTKASAALAANDTNHTCYIEWSNLPDGLESESTSYQATAKGGVSELGENTASFDAYIVNKAGQTSIVNSDSVTFESLAPEPISVSLDERLKLGEGLYSISVMDKQIGRYQGTSSRANIDIDLSNNTGETKQYKHNQLPFGEIQNFSAYADKLGDAKLWDRVPYVLKGSYRLAPEMSDTMNFDLVVTPHPYMQVLMELDETRYTSTDVILATISLGIKNNLTNTFDYNLETMGSGWDVFIAYKNGTEYEAITDVITVGNDGKGTLEVDADIIFNRNEAIYAVAKAQSPYPEIEIQRVSIPRSITVLKGTGVDGELVSRTVHSRIPAAFDLRFDTESFNDFMVLGSINWQRNEGGNWVDMTDIADRQYVTIRSEEPEVIDIRAIIANKETGALTETETIRLVSYDKPTMKIEGISQAIAGQAVELTAVDTNATPQDDIIVEWSLDGEVWESGFETYTVNVEDSSLRVYGRMKYANTADEIESGHWATAIKYISTTKPKAITMSLNRPSMAEVGTEIELKMMVSNSFVGTGIPLKTEWIHPDGTIIEDQKDILYTLLESDLDELNRATFKARAWLEGFKDVTLGEANAVMNTFTYQFPDESDLSLTVNNNIKFVPSTGFATVNMPYINAPGVTFSYDWTFDESAIEKVSSSGKGFNFKVIKAGVHEIMVTVSDNRGNFAHITDYVDAEEPNDLTFKLNDVYSNKYFRAPLTASIYPNVAVGHPYDFVNQYTWTVNGERGETSSRAVGSFDDLDVGHYEIVLDVQTNFGQVGQTTFTIDVVSNQVPVCEPSVRNQYSIFIVDANCKDVDGVISFYKWVVNGTIFSPFGPQVRFSESDYPTGATIVIEAVDDAGGIGVGHTNF